MLLGIYSAIYGEVNVSVSICGEIKGDYIEEQQSCFVSVTLNSWSGRKLLDQPSYFLSCPNLNLTGLVKSKFKYSPQHPILKHPQPKFLPQCQRPSFTPIQDNGYTYLKYYQKKNEWSYDIDSADFLSMLTFRRRNFLLNFSTPCI